MLLMAADRVDVIEGVLDDLARLHLPNIPKEMGLRAELRSNPKKLVKVAVVVGGGALALTLLARARGRTTA